VDQVQVPVFCIAQVLTKPAPGAMTVLSGMVTSLTYSDPLQELTIIEVGTRVFIAGVVVVFGVVKVNWGKRVAVGEPFGVSVGSAVARVMVDCIAASVLAASVEYCALICVAEAVLFGLLAA
jgi:hypothetical protein